jgi:molecular chaperone GrpE
VNHEAGRGTAGNEDAGSAPGAEPSPAASEAVTGGSGQPHGPTQGGPSQPGPSQTGPARGGPTQPGPSQHGPAQPGPTQPGPSQPGPAQGGLTQEPDVDMAARIAELEDQRLRALADLDNQRKKCAAQVSRAEAETRAAVARQWLPVVDNLDLALAHATADPSTIVDGVRAIHAQALDVLARLGFPRRDDRGARFDPARHEAVATRPDPGVDADLVADVIRPAYGEGDHQLRPAQVVVARPG